MANGENAEKIGHAGREYWSKRAGGGNGYWPWGPIGKWITHRKERQQAKATLKRELQNIATVAQLGEREIRNFEVVRSIRIGGSRFCGVDSHD